MRNRTVKLRARGRGGGQMPGLAGFGIARVSRERLCARPGWCARSSSIPVAAAESLLCKIESKIRSEFRVLAVALNLLQFSVRLRTTSSGFRPDGPETRFLLSEFEGIFTHVSRHPHTRFAQGLLLGSSSRSRRRRLRPCRAARQGQAGKIASRCPGWNFAGCYAGRNFL